MLSTGTNPTTPDALVEPLEPIKDPDDQLLWPKSKLPPKEYPLLKPLLSKDTSPLVSKKPDVGAEPEKEVQFPAEKNGRVLQLVR